MTAQVRFLSEGGERLAVFNIPADGWHRIPLQGEQKSAILRADCIVIDSGIAPGGLEPSPDDDVTSSAIAAVRAQVRAHSEHLVAIDAGLHYLPTLLGRVDLIERHGLRVHGEDLIELRTKVAELLGRIESLEGGR